MNSNEDIATIQLQKGMTISYKDVYSQNFSSVERFIVNNSGTSEDAKDIFQEAMIVLYEKLQRDDFVLTASLKTYIVAISKNLWLKHRRNVSNHRQIELSDLLSNQFHEEIALSIEKEKTYLERLETYLTKITQHCYRLIRAMFFMDKSAEEVQDEFGYTTKHNVQNQKYKCVEQIKKVKEQEDKKEM